MARPAFPSARFVRISTAFVAALLCTACGTSYVPIANTATGTSYASQPYTGVTGLTGSTGITISTTSTAPAAGGTAPLINEHISGVGYTSTSVTVDAASVLAMTFTPGTQEGEVSGTGYSPMYSYLGVYITVNGNSQNTGMLYNGLNTGEAEVSPVLNFSSSLSGSMQGVTITISQPNDDYFCLNFGDYCPWTQVYTGQPWNGTLEIQTDTTVAVTSGSSFL